MWDSFRVEGDHLYNKNREDIIKDVVVVDEESKPVPIKDRVFTGPKGNQKGADPKQPREYKIKLFRHQKKGLDKVKSCLFERPWPGQEGYILADEMVSNSPSFLSILNSLFSLFRVLARRSRLCTSSKNACVQGLIWC